MELSDRKFKRNTINMLRVLIEKYTTWKKHIDNVSSNMEIKNQKEMKKVKNTVTEIKTALDGLISRLSMERIGEIEYVNRNFPK